MVSICADLLERKGKTQSSSGNGLKAGEKGFESWDETDSMVMSWQWDSMEPRISDTVMFLTSAKAIWDSIRRTYSKARDTAQVYEIKIKVGAIKQGNKSVTEYAYQLQNLWHELDHYQVIEMKNSKDATILRNFIDKDRVYDFLAGLNSDFDQVRVQILGRDEVSPLEETITLIQAEESRRSVMLETQNQEGSAMVAANSNFSHSIQENGKGEQLKASGHDNRNDLYCTYCRKTGHTKEKCWKLHGRSPCEGNQRGGQPRNPAQANLNIGQLSQETNLKQNDLKEEIEKLKAMIMSLEKSGGEKSGCSLAFSRPGFGEEDWTG